MTVSPRISLVFYVLACALSWGVLGLFKLVSGGAGVMVALTAYMIMPAVAAILVQRFVVRGPVPEPLGVHFVASKWLIVAWFLPIVVALLAIPLTGLMPGIDLGFSPVRMFDDQIAKLTPEQLSQLKESLAQSKQTLEEVRGDWAERSPLAFFLFSLSGAAVASITVNAAAGLGEELGWRGLLVRELAPLGFWRQSVVIGVLWGLWHAPAILMFGHNYPDHPRLGVLLMTLFCVVVSPVIGYVRLRAKSVLAAAIFHGAINASAAFALLYAVGGDDLTRGLTGLPGFILYGLANVWLALKGAPGADEELAEIARANRPALAVVP